MNEVDISYRTSASLELEFQLGQIMSQISVVASKVSQYSEAKIANFYHKLLLILQKLLTDELILFHTIFKLPQQPQRPPFLPTWTNIQRKAVLIDIWSSNSDSLCI